MLASPAHAALHALVVTGGTAPSAELLAALGIEEPDVAVAALAAEGLVERHAHATVVTAAGRDAHGELLAMWRKEADLDALGRVYEAFAVVNGTLKAAVTEWQESRSGAGAELFWIMRDRLQSLHERAAPLLRRAANVDARFGAYRGLLRDVLDRLDAGEQDYISGIGVASYHTVWWWLHEDLLRSLDLKEENR